MRALIDLPNDDLARLTELGWHQGRSRAAVVRDAVHLYLAAHRSPPPAAAFGAWGQGEDGLALQDRLRAEW